ncbi:MAG TPA: hypothetical protein VK864_13460, partial [Longimicrobiales bacterium]|nr:hypothetical protein [Longimicrobiales bacterium]
MMKRIWRTGMLALVFTATACSDDFFQVTDPDILESTAIDPVRDGPVLARSAYQNFADSFSQTAVYIAWWAYEARVGDTFPTRNEFGRRFLDDTNGTLNGDVWSPMARAASTSEQAVGILKDTPGLPLAIAAFSTAYSLLIMAETFCEGTVSAVAGEPGEKMTTAQLLDLAIERFTLARSEAQKLTGGEAAGIAQAALVGIARAHLFAGRKTEAAAAATQVTPSFVYNLVYVDDPANRGRTGNEIETFSASRLSLVVPPEYRAIADAGDPRISYKDTGVLAQDSELWFYRQMKFNGWGIPIRLASGLEARYIVAEATGDINARLTLINERRAVGGQTALASNDPDVVLAALMEQRALDFWLEGKKMGDYRRNPGFVPFFLPDNSEYYKPGVGEVGSQTCWPVPDAEKRHNPNW